MTMMNMYVLWSSSPWTFIDCWAYCDFLMLLSL